MSSTPRIFISAAVLLFAACAHRKAPAPPLTHVEFGNSRAAYRSYSATAACEAEPRWLAEELGSVNALLSRFLATTDKPLDEQWLPQEEAMLASGRNALTPVLEVHASNLRAAKKCSFARHSALVHVLKEGPALIQDVRSRLEIADQLAAHLAGRRALAAWRERVKTERVEYLSFCAPRSHEIYFAYQDEAGATHVLFCDDARLTYPPGSVTGEVSIPGPTKPRALRNRLEALYVKKATAYPKEEVRVPPLVPPAPEQSRAAR